MVADPVIFSTTNAVAATASPSFSQTNTQVAGVDEGDTVKTDGQDLYLISNGDLVILNAWPATALSTLSETPLTGSPLVEYLNGDRLTVISQGCDQDGSIVSVTVFDVSDRTAPTVVQQTTLDGTYNNSRAIGTTVYVALNNNLPNLPYPEYTTVGDSTVYETEAAYVARMEALPLDSLLPHYTTHFSDGTPDLTGLLTPVADIYQPGLATENTLMSLVSLDVSGADTGPTNSVSFLTSYDATLYAAPDNFYLITTQSSYYNNWTFIDKLSLQGGDITLTATGIVPGAILNQFSVGEDGAYLDVATTTDVMGVLSNNLYVLAEQGQVLEVVGKVENLAPGEQIYSVAFLGDRAFVTTFRKFDPLFVVDLSDPTDPVVTGQLEVAGYTGYLQPIDATHLLGIGRDVDPVTNEPTDFEFSVFDVSDPNHPTLASRYHVAVDGLWDWSFTNFDYHAVTYYPETQTLAFPIRGEQGETPPGEQTYWNPQSDLLVFHIDGTSGTLNLSGQIGDTSPIQRSVFIGNYVYAISDTTVQVYSLDDLTTRVGQVQLPGTPTGFNWWDLDQINLGPIGYWGGGGVGIDPINGIDTLLMSLPIQIVAVGSGVVTISDPQSGGTPAPISTGTGSTGANPIANPIDGPTAPTAPGPTGDPKISGPIAPTPGSSPPAQVPPINVPVANAPAAVSVPSSPSAFLVTTSGTATGNLPSVQVIAPTTAPTSTTAVPAAAVGLQNPFANLDIGVGGQEQTTPGPLDSEELKSALELGSEQASALFNGWFTIEGASAGRRGRGRPARGVGFVLARGIPGRQRLTAAGHQGTRSRTTTRRDRQLGEDGVLAAVDSGGSRVATRPSGGRSCGEKASTTLERFAVGLALAGRASDGSSQDPSLARPANQIRRWRVRLSLPQKPRTASLYCCCNRRVSGPGLPSPTG